MTEPRQREAKLIVRSAKLTQPQVPGADALAGVIARFARTDGDHATIIPALSLHRRQSPTAPLHCIFNLGLGVVAQGNKEALVGEDVVRYGPGQSMLTTIDLPVISHVTRASALEPLLGLMLTLDIRHVVQQATDLGSPPPVKSATFKRITVEMLDAPLIDALIRLVGLLDEPEVAPHLAPLVQTEIIVRLLTGAHGPQLQHLAANGSPSQQIAKSVAWLKRNFAETLRVDELAAIASMSPTTFRHHFKVITGTSPLQYQKTLRLQEARQLMLSQDIDAGNAGARVGYESPSQFSREYSRFFGSPPQQDVKRLRTLATVTSVRA